MATEKTKPLSLIDANARALSLFYHRSEAAFMRMQNDMEWGKLTVEINFEEGRAVNKIDTTTIQRDRL